MNNSLARIDASELGRRLASRRCRKRIRVSPVGLSALGLGQDCSAARPSRGGHPLACALLLTQVQKGAAAGVVVLITAAVGYTWSGIFGLIAGVVLGTVLVGVLCGLLALLINIRDLLAESLTKRG